MEDNQMLQILIDGQSAIRNDINGLEKKIDKVDSRVTNLGLSIAHLEDDSPTVKEFNNLEKRVTRLENKLAS